MVSTNFVPTVIRPVASRCAFFIFLSLALWFSPARADQNCTKRANFFSSLPAHSMTLEDAFSKLFSDKPRLILMGESHYSPSPDVEARLIQAAHSADNNLNCVFFEIPQEEADGQWGEFRGDLQNLSPSNLLYGNDQWQKDVEMARREGMRIFFVDNWDTPPGTPVLSSQGMTFRNQKMAENILATLNKKVCTGGIAVNGKYHLLNSPLNGYPSLTSLISKAGVPLKTINLQDVYLGATVNSNPPVPPRRSNEYDPDWVWESCGPTAFAPAKRVAFTNDWFCGVPLRENSHGHWDDFDFTFVLP